MPDHADTPQVSQIVTFPAQAASGTAPPCSSLSAIPHKIRGRATYREHGHGVAPPRQRQIREHAGWTEPLPWPPPGRPSPRRVTAPGCYGQGRARGRPNTCCLRLPRHRPHLGADGPVPAPPHRPNDASSNRPDHGGSFVFQGTELPRHGQAKTPSGGATWARIGRDQALRANRTGPSPHLSSSMAPTPERGSPYLLLMLIASFLEASHSSRTQSGPVLA